jgi:small redox-active disulfide protein 2
MTVKILGTGCTKCKRLEEKVRALIILNSINADVEKVTGIDEIIKFNIMRTPGLVINNKMVSSGVIPSDEQILSWLKEG